MKTTNQFKVHCNNYQDIYIAAASRSTQRLELNCFITARLSLFGRMANEIVNSPRKLHKQKLEKMLKC